MRQHGRSPDGVGGRAVHGHVFRPGTSPAGSAGYAPHAARTSRIAGSLFAPRYGLSRRLDLRPPLAALVPFRFGFDPAPQARYSRPQSIPSPDAGDEGEDAANLSSSRSPNGDPDANFEDASNESTDPAGQRSGDSRKRAGQGNANQNSDDSDEAQAEQDESQTGPDSGPKSASGAEKKQQSGGKPQSRNSESSSLLDKMKDRMQNLLPSVKPAQSDAGQPGDSSQDGQAASTQPQGKGNSKSDSAQTGKQAGSGIGTQDGDKGIKAAEDLAAMGKITELLGKRSASISGQATVAVQSTSQQLRTPYAERSSQHVQDGAEISRDEVPVAMQQYVEQYFERVRKQAAAPRK